MTTTTSVRTTRIFLVDDHAIVRQGLRAVLGNRPEIEVVGEAGDAAGALSGVMAARPDVVLLDLKLSAAADAEGLDLCSALTRAHPGLGVLVLTTLLDDRLVIDAIHRGARGYVVKDVDSSELVRAIATVSRGGTAFDAHSSAAMVRTLNGPPPPVHQLTAREQEILRLVAAGRSTRDIGAQLFVSETTVKFHVGNLMRKLGVSRRAEAVYAATRLGLL